MVSSSSIVKWKLSHLHLQRADWAGGRYSPLLYKNCSITHTTFTTEASTWTSNTLPFFPDGKKKSVHMWCGKHSIHTAKSFCSSSHNCHCYLCRTFFRADCTRNTWIPARLLRWARPPLCGTCSRTAAQLSPEGRQASLKDRQSSNLWKQQTKLFLLLWAGGFWPSVCVLIPQMQIPTYI